MTSPVEAVDAAAGRKAALAEAALLWNALFLNDARIAFRAEATPRVSIVIVARGARHMLAWTLYRLAAGQVLGGVPFEVIVVDNASDSETRALYGRVDGATVLLNDANIGFGPACNAGAARARGDYLLFLNPDVDLMPGALRALLDTFEEFDHVGIAGARLVFPGGLLQEAGANFRDDAQTTHPYGRGGADPFAPEASFAREVGYVSGAVLLIEAGLFRQLGGFDDWFAPAYFEDTDLCVRCHQAGRRVIYQPRAIAIHVENVTSARRDDVEQLLDRNRARFRERHAAWLFGQGPQRTGFAARDHDPWTLRILYVEDRAPHLDLGAGLPRANAILNAMAELGYAVTFASIHGEREEAARLYRDLSTRIEIVEPCGEAGLRDLVRERPDYYDVLWVSRPPNIERVCGVLYDLGLTPRDVGRTRVVFDTEAVFALRDFVTEALAGAPANGPALARACVREIRRFAVADHVVCVSEGEARVLRAHGVPNATVLGHALVANDAAPGFTARDGFVFLGSLAREGEPNIDSLDWFFANVWPLLRARLPAAHVTVVGAVAPSIRERLAGEGVRILGRVDDVGPVLDAARVALAPTRFAAGIPHKVHETVAHGLPGVVTPILAEQLGWPDGTGSLVRDWRDPEGFAEALADLHTDEALWTGVQAAGLARIRHECDPATYARTLRTLCEAPTFA